MMDRRGASEVIGFVLIVSLVLLTTSVVFVSGFSGLEDTRDAERVENAERAFDVLDDNMGDITYRNAPARATEIKLADAELALVANTQITIEATNGAGTQSVTRETRPVVFTAGDGDSKVVYEAGAVFRQEPEGAVMNSEPGLVFDPQLTTLTVLEASSPSTSSVGGSSTVLVRASADNSATDDSERTELLYTKSGSPVDVTITITTAPERADAWARYVESELSENSVAAPPDPCTVSGGTVTCEFDTSQVRVAVSVIDISIES